MTEVMTLGEHTITIRVDNARLPPVGPSHAVDERTQTNWNGIIGKIELRATAPVWLDDIQVYPNAEEKKACIRVKVANITGEVASGQITVRCESYNVAEPSTFKIQLVEVKADQQENVVEFACELGDNVVLWDEFRPAMLRLHLDPETTAGEKRYHDRRSINFGMRDFSTRRNQFTINGRPVFLRGKLDCCLFPLTGYRSYAANARTGWLPPAGYSRLSGAGYRSGRHPQRVHGIERAHYAGGVATVLL